MRFAVVLVMLVGCGRIGYEPREAQIDAPTTDSQPDGPVVPVCPAGTTEITAGASVCVEQAERGGDTWTNAKAVCNADGRRLCGDAEWLTACVDAAGLVDMANDGGGANPNWEWVAEESAGVAQKRGYAACSDTAAHEIFVDSYDYRCCVDKN